jgi:hypothetical protein
MKRLFLGIALAVGLLAAFGASDASAAPRHRSHYRSHYDGGHYHAPRSHWHYEDSYHPRSYYRPHYDYHHHYDHGHYHYHHGYHHDGHFGIDVHRPGLSFHFGY